INEEIDEFLESINLISMEKIKLRKIKQDIGDINQRFEKELEDLKEEFAKVKREIDIPNLDIDDFMKINNEKERYIKEIKGLNKQKKVRDELGKSVSEKIRELDELYLEEYRLYCNEINKINSSQNDLKIDIGFKDNKQAFIDHMRSTFKGSGLRANHYQEIVNMYPDYLEIFRDIVFGEKKLANMLTQSNYVKFLNVFANKMNELISYKTPNIISIKYHDKPLSQHSMGQRASALLLFILTQKDNDLIIIDQPEDDLDNQVIYKELIKNIKKKKRDIQFIFATHNANIPVLGDAERVTACYYNDKINLISGSIDKKDIQNRIIKIMEGGKEAFNKRNEIYKLWRYNS
ncbi:MAG: ATP-binding protein, partial [Clostridia bacterium]|nr:ATP-binding protein [Clostridia bacterium]